jgi:hypothetical protein
VDTFVKLVRAIPNFSEWTKQERIALLAWYQALFAGSVKKAELCTMVEIFSKQCELGLSRTDIDGGKLFSDLTKRKRPMLEKIDVGQYRVTDTTRARFRKYEQLVAAFEDERWRAIGERVEKREALRRAVEVRSPSTAPAKAPGEE